MVADGRLVAQSAWLNSALARRAVPIDTRGRRPAAMERPPMPAA